MRVVFFKRENSWDPPVAEAFCAGAAIYAHKVEIKSISEATLKQDSEGAQVIALVGITSIRLPVELIKKIKATGTRIIYLDKGHFGRGEYVRVSIDEFKPLRYLMQLAAPHDRLRKLQEKYKLALRPMKRDGDHVVFAGSSNKYSEIQGLGGEYAFASDVIQALRKKTARGIVYRPKPSFSMEAVPIEGTFFSRPPRSLLQELDGAHCLITHGSNAGAEALIHGVPVITLGDGVSRPLSRTSIDSIEDLHYPDDKERMQWLANLAYCQWSLSELRSGEAWESISEQLKRH